MTAGLPPALLDSLKYTGDRVNVVPCFNAPRAPLTTDRNYPLLTLWRYANKIPDADGNSEGDLWYLARFQAVVAGNADAIWVPLSLGNPSVETFIPDSGTSPIVGSSINVTAASIEPTGTTINALRSFGSASNTLAYRLQYAGQNAGVAIAGKYGVAQFDSTSFTVANGFVTLNNAPVGPVTSIQGNDGVLTSPSAGVINILGAVAANGTYALPIFVRNLSGNTEQVVMQLATARASSNLNSSGICHFDSSVFSVDGNGFVTISGGSLGILTLTGDTGGAVGATASNVNMSGATTTYVIGNPGTSTLRHEVVSTNHAFLIGRGPTTASATLGPLTNGQLIIGNTGNDPSLATLTAGSNITITNGAGTIQISSSAVGLTWQTITASQTLAVNNGYFCVSAGGALNLALPATSSVGDIIEISLDGATSYTVTQGVGQQIRMGSVQTTSGVGGSLATNAQGDTLRLVCSVANTKWNVMSSMGNFTVV